MLFRSPGSSEHSDAWLDRLLELLRPRAKRLGDFVDQARPFLLEAPEFDEDAVAKHLSGKTAAGYLDAMGQLLGTLEPFDEGTVEAAVRGLAERLAIKAGALMHPIRVALVGRTTSPGLFESLVLIGRAQSIARLARGAALARSRG